MVAGGGPQGQEGILRFDWAFKLAKTHLLILSLIFYHYSERAVQSREITMDSADCEGRETFKENYSDLFVTVSMIMWVSDWSTFFLVGSYIAITVFHISSCMHVMLYAMPCQHDVSNVQCIRGRSLKSTIVAQDHYIPCGFVDHKHPLMFNHSTTLRFFSNKLSGFRLLRLECWFLFSAYICLNCSVCILLP